MQPKIFLTFCMKHSKFILSMTPILTYFHMGFRLLLTFAYYKFQAIPANEHYLSSVMWLGDDENAMSMYQIWYFRLLHKMQNCNMQNFERFRCGWDIFFSPYMHACLMAGFRKDWIDITLICAKLLAFKCKMRSRNGSNNFWNWQSIFWIWLH